MSRHLLTTVLFLAIVAVTVGITFWASRADQRHQRLLRRRPLSSRGIQNGLAIGGDYMCAASFLGISGAIALYGYDGFLYSIGFLVAWLVALLLVAEMLRNSGQLHDGRPAGLPDEAAPGAHRGGDLHRGRVDLLPARADGRRRGCWCTLLLGIEPE